MTTADNSAVLHLVETDEQKALREVAYSLGARYGMDYMRAKSEAGETTSELWAEAGRLGLLGVNIPEEYGGGGAGMYELALVEEELSAAGAGLLMMVVSPAINGSIISRFGTDEQKRTWLPGIASGDLTAAFAITEPDAGSNSHKITTTARRSGDEWVVAGQKTFISGVDQSDVILVVARLEDQAEGGLKPALFLVPTDAEGVSYTHIPMEVKAPERQYQLFFDDVRLPADALVGEEGAAIAQLFAGLNPERIIASAMSVGQARYAVDRAVDYARERTVFKNPIGSHQGVAHPLAQVKIELELAKVMYQKAAALYDAGEESAAAESANMAKYAAGEVCARAVDQAVQTLGGNGLTTEYGVAGLLAASRLPRIAPVSREMILNFVAQHSLGLPKSY